MGEASGTFQRSLRGSLLLAQLLGLMPWDRACAGLYPVTSLVAILGTAVMAILSIYWFWLNKTVFRATKVIFFMTSTLACLLLRKLGRSWPSIARVWKSSEEATAHIGYPPETVFYSNVFTTGFIVIAVVEHGYAIANVLTSVVNAEHRFGVGAIVHGWVHRWFPQVLLVVPYSPFLLIPLLLLNTVATFTFSYISLLITNLAFCLYSMFRQFNTYVHLASQKQYPRPSWGRLYKDFRVLRSLVATVDTHICQLILLSFFINLYHVCIQLYLSLTSQYTLAGKLYFCLSFGFLVLKTISVCLSAALLNEEATRSKYILFTVPAAEYTNEVERFLFQICNDCVSLSANRCFILTRSTLLTVIGLVMTYEIVMFQFHMYAGEEDDMNNSTESSLTTTAKI